MSKIVVVTAAGTITVSSPYHPDFAPRARKLGGRWQSATKTWTFDARDEDRVRALLRDVFGDDSSAPVETLTVRCGSGPLEGRSTGGSCRNTSRWLAGREVARVFGRDSGAKLGEGVVVLKGGFSSGGSVKNPSCDYTDDLEIEVRDVPKDKALAVHASYHGVTLLDAGGNVVLAETYETPVVEAAARLGGTEAADAVRASELKTPIVLELAAKIGLPIENVRHEPTFVECPGQVGWCGHCGEIKEVHAGGVCRTALDSIEREIAAAEGRLAGLRFRAAELRAA